jgi:hypothetical protein
MSSSINPNNIDGNFPVAGQPNNTQGFRDNFTNIKTNFSTAATEITDLENNGIFKSALAGTTLDNNMSDNLIYAAAIRDFSAVAVQLTATSGSITVDYSAGHYQTISTTGSISLNFTNFPPSGSAGIIRLSIAITNTAYTLTLPAAVSLGTTGIQGYAASVITFAATGTYQFEFSTVDSGTTITIFDLNRALTAYTNPFGYVAGGGGTVTQATNKATGVTLNKPSGQITMQNTNLAAATIVSFVLTNSTIAATDLLVINHVSGGTIGSYTLDAACAAGSATIYVRNNTAGTLGEALVIRYAVIKGAVA